MTTTRLTDPSPLDPTTALPVLEALDLAKTFTMHLQGGVRLPVLSGVRFTLYPGECAVLDGPSGIGKSTILKMIHGTYGIDSGALLLRGPDGAVTDLARADDRTMLRLRRTTLGYVSQFLRCVPRVPTLDVVAEPLLSARVPPEDARRRAGHLLERLRVPTGLWMLPPATFSGGEKQRVNIARGFVSDHPVLLLDEPTASLDAANRAEVVDLIEDQKAAGAAILAIFHDPRVRAEVADRLIDVGVFVPSGAVRSGRVPSGAGRSGPVPSGVENEESR